MKKNKLLKIFNKLSGTDPKMLDGFRMFDEGIASLKENLEQTIKVSTLEELNGKLKQFKDKIDFTPLQEAFDVLKGEIQERDEQYNSEIREELETKLAEVNKSLEDRDGVSETNFKTIYEEKESLQRQITDLMNRKPPEFPDFNLPLKEAENRLLATIQELQTDVQNRDKTEEIRKEFESALKKLRADLLSVINSVGGGAMNRQILFNGVDYLKQYTDINYIPGNNVSFTVVNNQAKNRVDVTINATGGSGSGIIRSINSVAVDTLAGSAPTTDYVYLVSGTTTITLPTAVGNSNLYTIKNVGTGIVTVAFTGGETGDGETTLIMPVQYTSIDLVSDTANYNIT